MPSNLPDDCTQADIDAQWLSDKQERELEWWHGLTDEQRDRIWPGWREEEES